MIRKYKLNKKKCLNCQHAIACKHTPVACKYFSEMNKVLDIFETYQYLNEDNGLNFYE